MKTTQIYITITLAVASLFICGNTKVQKEKISKEKMLSIKNEFKHNSEDAILKLYIRKGELFDQPCESKLLICIKGNLITAVGLDCENEYSIFDYYEGKITGSKIEGNASLIDNCGGSGEGSEMCLQQKTFVMELMNDSSELKYNEQQFFKSENQITFKSEGLTIYEAPNFSSKTIEKIQEENASLKLLEIGSLEKKGAEWNVWYKVKTATNEGWCFGNLNF